LHEIKQDGFRLIARRNPKDVRLYTRAQDQKPGSTGGAERGRRKMALTNKP